MDVSSNITSNIINQLFTWLGSHGFSFGQILVLGGIILFYLKSFLPFKKNFDTYSENSRSRMDSLHNAIREIQLHLRDKKRGSTQFDPMHSLDKLEWASSNSPFQLNEMGISLSKNSGIGTVIEENAKELVTTMHQKELVTGYDVEQCALHTLQDYVNDHPKYITKIKEYVFNNPVLNDKQVGLQDIFFVGSILLRDVYLEKYPLQ